MNLELLRRFFDIRLDDVARLSGYSSSLISLCENGYRNPTKDFCKKICKAICILVSKKIIPDNLFSYPPRLKESDGKGKIRHEPTDSYPKYPRI